MNILYIPWRDYYNMLEDGFRTREANLLLKLIEDKRVDKILCINQGRGHTIFRNGKKFIKKLLGYNSVKENNVNKQKKVYKSPFSTLFQISNKLYILDINYYIPFGEKIESYNFGKRLLQGETEKALKYLNINEFITWTSDLSRVKVAENLNKSFLVFDAIDNLLEHNQFQNKKNEIKNNYSFICEHADIIFTVSKELKNKLFNNRDNVFYTPNGINSFLFKNMEYGRPSDLPNNYPIVMYIGIMQERVDVNMLESAIRSLQNINFVFIGPVITPKYFRSLKKYNNVFFLGKKHYSQVPCYLSFADICVIPHKVNDFTKSMNPLKLYEYLAAGKKIISTPVPPTEDFQGIISVVNSNQEFEEEIVKQLSRSSKVESENRNFIEKIVNQNDWKVRLNFMLSKIESYMK